MTKNMKYFTVPLTFGLFLSWVVFVPLRSQESSPKKILIVVEGTDDLKNYSMGDGRQLATLLGHFNSLSTVKGVTKYVSGEMNYYDYTFYVGFTAHNSPPSNFLDDLFATTKPVIWLNTGFADFSLRYPVRKKFGFVVLRLDSLQGFDNVRAGQRTYTKGEPNTNMIAVIDPKTVSVLATAFSSKKRTETPYVVRSRNLLYFADSPFASATEGDRYLLFADMLHEILGEFHEESHTALVRIEDVDPLENPSHLRDIADLLSSKGIPFLVGVVPFYVDPAEGIRVSLSDKPDFVDALKYMVHNGGTIVMHGITHQYKGTTAVDFEFWDESTNKPIKDETPEGDARKIEMGIQEFMKNGLSPLIWETPHYTASFTLYRTIAKYFSTAMEQRLSIEDADYSQYFPYMINKDLFGQKIYPENLGYVPLSADKNVNATAIQTILRHAKSNLAVRDGFASFFFHPFLDITLLAELVDGIQKLGYTYLDVREQTHWVKTRDRVILTGTQNYSISLEDQYLAESYFDHSGEIKSKDVSEKRLRGAMTKTVTLVPGELYKAEPTEFRERPASFAEQARYTVQKVYDNLFSAEESWNEMRVAVLWNHFAKGAAYNDQASFISVFRSVNVRVDTVFLGQLVDLSPYNLVVIPYAFIDSLSQSGYDLINAFVEKGGHIVTDTRSDLTEDLGIAFTQTRLRVSKIRDLYFPEERIVWRYSELVTKFETDGVDEVFCVDEATEAPMAIGKRISKGKLIYINSRFDSYSQHGYSQYPYLLDYIVKYFHLRPIVRRENLEMFFDPGFRRTYSIESLVKQWVKLGVRVVHAAGWNQFPKYTYDYARLISLAHANGILVYAWLEPPQVSQMFWNQHPEWREKNYKGEDMPPMWRYALALTDDKCLAAVVDEYRKILEAYDWDGVDLAELYFEAGKGFDNPNLFSPMHSSAQREVRRAHGFDLASIFNPLSPYYWKNNTAVKNAVIEYRVDQLRRAYETFLSAFSDIARNRDGFQIIVTAMDAYGSPELREYLGVDMDQILVLQKKYGFTLQVEDAENLWSTDPMRYLEIGRRYTKLIGDSSKLQLDLNIVYTRKQESITPFPTLIQTGTESFQLVKAAALGAPRSTIYSEASVLPQDLNFLANALAARVRYNHDADGYQVTSPFSFVLKLPPDIATITVDGSPFSPYRDNLYLVPAGEHRIVPLRIPVGSFSTTGLQTRIMSLTGNILAITRGLRTVSFEYQSATRTLATFNLRPSAVRVDQNEYPFTVMKGNDCFSIFLPQGHHTVDVVSGNQFSYGVSVTSLWSTTAIAMFGFAAVTSLLLMYLGLKVIKRRGSSKEHRTP